MKNRISFVKMKNTRVYIAFHQKGKIIPSDKVYSALHVGKSASNIDLGIEHDADKRNISDKNEIYSELTGWYWIWKNRKHDVVGTSHYRRYFLNRPISFQKKIGKLFLFPLGLLKKRHGLLYVRNVNKWKKRILTEEDIHSLLNEYDIILPQPKKFKYSVYQQYQRRHKEKDIILTRKIINEKYPDYLNAFDHVFGNKEMYPFNMFIMPWELFDIYMNWLFELLFELEKRADIHMDDKYQKRLCAFMAERLQTVWIKNNDLKVKELPVLYFKKLRKAHF